MIDPHRSSDQPSDTRMMALVHAALRRDLQRASALLGEPHRLEADRVRALGRHLVWFIEFLHAHHSAEDEHLFPLVANRRPDLETLIALMDDEHHQIAPALDRLQVLAVHTARGETTDTSAVRALSDSVSVLSRVPTRHLYDEETLMMPVVEQTLTEAEWRTYDRENLRRSTAELAFIGHWLLDGLEDEQDRRKVTSQVPRAVSWVLIHLMGGRYRRHVRATWEGTPARSIASAPLPRVVPVATRGDREV